MGIAPTLSEKLETELKRLDGLYRAAKAKDDLGEALNQRDNIARLIIENMIVLQAIIAEYNRPLSDGCEPEEDRIPF